MGLLTKRADPALALLLTAHERRDDRLAQHLDWIRSEGVRGADIAGYGGRSPKKRDKIAKHDDAMSRAFYVTEYQHTNDQAAATAATRKAVYLLGDIGDYEMDVAEGVPQQDRRLPIELIDRISRWNTKQVLHGRKALRETSAKYSSVNAQIREAITRGEI